ncbi:hypothetical protein [Streptomyces rochei]|uniref:hypothetical protein n=1 Tax=Streptomyces rochei TaxID=1928 RepID=UPI003701E80F
MTVHNAYDGDWLSDHVKTRLAAPLDRVPDIDPTPAEMDDLLVELKSAGRALRAKLRETPTVAPSEETAANWPTETPKSASSPCTDPDFASLLLRWAHEYRAAQERWEWFIAAGNFRRKWKQRTDRYRFVPLYDVLHTPSAPSHKQIPQRMIRLSFQLGSGKTQTALKVIEHLALNRGTKFLERRYTIEKFASLSVQSPCRPVDIPLCSCSPADPDGGLLVIFIDSHAAFQPAARRDESPSDARKRTRVAALQRRRERLPTPEVPPAPSLVLIVDACPSTAPPERAASDAGVGLYVPLPRELRPAIHHLEEVQTWWRETLDDYASNPRRDSAI